jgi:hypothetical protein
VRLTGSDWRVCDDRTRPDPIETRRGFAELFDRIEDHAVRVVKQK